MSEEGLIVLDTSFEVMSCNAAAQELFGKTLLNGHPIPMGPLLSEKSVSALEKAILKALTQGTAQIDFKVYLKSGLSTLLYCSIHPLYAVESKVMGVILSFRKVPERSPSSETEDGQSSFEQEALLEALPEGVFTINTKWRIASFNKTAETITGYKREEVIGKFCRDVFRSDLCDLGCPLKTALETGQVGTDQDVRILKKGGGRQTILVNTGVLRDKKGLIIGAVETFRPLTGEVNVPADTDEPHPFSEIIGKSEIIQRLFAVLPDIAASEANVFITGESGTGKELFARTIHDNSSRAKHPFVAVNCSALAESLLESELFGHEKAAFTGATSTKPGRFELAQKGTLFLDEIGELKPSLQIKLLRVLEEREFERVGGTRTIALEARIISATNKDLSQALVQGTFREDFYYRLRTVPLVIPPLRKRKEDIPLLVDAFIQRFNRTFKKEVRSVESSVMKLFLDYHWPGNIRELKRTIEHAFVFVKGPVILMKNLPQLELFEHPEKAEEKQFKKRARLTRKSVLQALQETDGKKALAAELLGISRTSLWRFMKHNHLLD